MDALTGGAPAGHEVAKVDLDEGMRETRRISVVVRQGKSLRYYLQHGWAIAKGHWYLRSAERGGRIRMWGRVRVHNEGRLIVGSGCAFHAGTQSTAMTIMSEGLLEFGPECRVNFGCTFIASGSIRIGARCRFGIGAMIMDSGQHRLEPEMRDVRDVPRPVVLEDDVWIGSRALVLAGVHIARGSVVAAGSVVTKDVPERCLAGGNPARILRQIPMPPADLVVVPG